MQKEPSLIIMKMEQPSIQTDIFDYSLHMIYTDYKAYYTYNQLIEEYIYHHNYFSNDNFRTQFTDMESAIHGESEYLLRSALTSIER